jgi:hypothetical protein
VIEFSYGNHLWAEAIKLPRTYSVTIAMKMQNGAWWRRFRRDLRAAKPHHRRKWRSLKGK